jgi:hypothetical protein
VLLAAFIVIMISAISYTAIFNPGGVTESALLVLFLSSYTMLLFTFSHVFSNTSRVRAQIISVGFGVASLAFSFAGLTAPLSDSYTTLRVAIFFIIAFYCFGIAVYMQKKQEVQKKGRWYLAAQPPALFLSLIIFFNILYSGAVEIWQPYLMDVFGFTFAVLIILYLSSLFNWKTVGIFAGLLTIIDIILVIGTGTMVTAAQQFTGLGLPVLVYLPNFPLIYNLEGLIQYRGLGLGDFFFAGILLVQTYKKFGKKIALAAAVAMAVAFGIWEAYLSEVLAALEPIVGRDIGGFPGTLMIICGWIPVVVVAWLLQKKKSVPSISSGAVETVSSPNPQ